MSRKPYSHIQQGRTLSSKSQNKEQLLQFIPQLRGGKGGRGNHMSIFVGHQLHRKKSQNFACNMMTICLKAASL